MTSPHQDLYKKHTTKEVADMLAYLSGLDEITFAEEIAECMAELRTRLMDFEYDALACCNFAWDAYASHAEQAAA